MPMDEFMFDKRIVGRNLVKKTLTAEQYQQYLKGLKDLATESQPFESALTVSHRRVQKRTMDNEDDEL